MVNATFYKSNNSRNALVIEINDQNSKKALTELVILQNASLGLDPGYDAAKLYGNNELMFIPSLTQIMIKHIPYNQFQILKSKL